MTPAQLTGQAALAGVCQGMAMGTGRSTCGGSTAAAAPAGTPAAPALTPQQQYEIVTTAVSQATAQVQLPSPSPQVGPDAHLNQWGMLAVGLPVWFWTQQVPSIDASRTQNGIAITLIATRSATHFDLGDGTTLDCTTSTPRPADAAPMATSPDCGHVYTRHGSYTVTATTDWGLAWSALGYSGTDTQRRTATTTITVGQLAAVGTTHP